ncbi:hypothetical protein EIN46_14165 [Salmonella enterica]|nr:hypothetical protein [Salmonella enterica]
MKRKTLLLIAALVALPGVTYADSPFSSLQSAHEKNTILKDLRKMCTPKGALTDEAWEKKIMANEGNQQHIREAMIAIERNNQHNYWQALGKVECPEM